MLARVCGEVPPVRIHPPRSKGENEQKSEEMGTHRNKLNGR